MKYHWYGTDKEQKICHGNINARNISAAKVQLYLQGIAVKKIVRPSIKLWPAKIKPTEICAFTQQLAGMLAAGLSVTQALTIMVNSTKQTTWQELLYHLQDSLAQGLSLHESLAQHPHYFDSLYCQLVKAGEASGTLAVLLQKLATTQIQKQNLIKKLKKALTYPAIVLSVAMVVSIVLMTKVIPQFAQLFTQSKTALPLLTQWVLSISDALQAIGGYLVVSLLAISIILVWSYRRFTQLRLPLHRILLSLPLVQRLTQQVVLTRSCTILAMMNTATIPLPDILTMIADTCPNLVYRETWLQTRAHVIAGHSLQQALQASSLFPNLLIQLITTGEETGNLSILAQQAAAFYQTELDHSLEQFSTLLEPLVMIILGILIGATIIAMYLPIFKIGQVI